jgi:O-acetyl-ADP-ribose deacetylase (regulator of RNase III)
LTGRFDVVRGDITKLAVDAIVNAANGSLLGGGGVDGAIHRAAGPRLLEECRKLRGCEVGQAKHTKGYDLPAKWVIHTVGPTWEGGSRGEPGLLADAYRNSLQLAARIGAKTVAFPSISTGAYCYPVERAARIAIREILAHLAKYGLPEQVTMVCFNEPTFEAYRNALAEANPAR